MSAIIAFAVSKKLTNFSMYKGVTQAEIIRSANPFTGGHSCFRCGSGWSMLSTDSQKSIVPVSVLFSNRARAVHVALLVMF